MNHKKATKASLIDYFFRTEGQDRSASALDENLEEVLKLNLDPKELALVLFHSSKHAVSPRALYGDPKVAQSVIEGHIQKWVDKAIRHKEGYSSFTVAHMLGTFEILGLKPPARFTEFIEKKATELMPTFKTEDMVFTLSAMASLGMHFDKKFFSEMQKRMPAVRGAMSGSDVYKTFHSLAVIDAIGEHMRGSKRFSLGGIFSEMLEDPLVRKKLVEADTNTSRRMLLDSSFWFKGKAPLPYPKEDEVGSIFEQDVAKAFSGADAKISDKPLVIKETHHKLDLSASFNQTTFYVECDGPTHFVRSADDHRVFLNGKTILQTALMARRQPDMLLVRMPYDVFYNNIDHADMMGYLLLQLEEQKKGAFLVGANGDLIPLMAGFNVDLSFKDNEPS